MKAVLAKAALVVFAAVCAATAQAATGGSFGVGAFGGFGTSGNQDLVQTGTAHRRGDFAVSETNEGETVTYSDFDLKVHVNGKPENNTAGIFGAHAWYEWHSATSSLRPAIEIEGFRVASTEESSLANSETEVLAHTDVNDEHYHDLVEFIDHHYPPGEHSFANSMDLRSLLLMANGVVGFGKEQSRWRPYAGLGIGLAVVKRNDAVSIQTGPGGVEFTSDTHELVNHFNSIDHGTDSAFAFQAKLGARAKIATSLSLFAEYRFLHIASTEFTFGSTSYTGHAPTDAWHLESGAMNTHNALFGVDYTL